MSLTITSDDCQDIERSKRIDMKHLILFIISVVIVTATAPDAQCRSYYNSVRNNFGGLYPHPGMRMQGRYKAIEDDRLVDENATTATAVGLDTMLVQSLAYHYQLRLANTNNKQGKTRNIRDRLTGQNTTITSSEWGMVFNHDTDGNYCAVVLSCDNSAPFDDITYVRSMRISLIERVSNQVKELACATVTRGVSLEDELNTISIDVDERHVKVSVGKNELQPVLEANANRPVGPVQVGYLVGPGASVSIERAVLTIENEKQVIQSTSWTRDALDEYFSQSVDPIEGYWQYLDRDMQDEWLRLGGRYTLAVVGTDDGYDLIYIDGAQVKKSMWQTGMKKGHMKKTIFTGNYDLNWIDATMEPIDQDANASVENGVILTLYFPTYKSQVRFAKVMNPEG